MLGAKQILEDSYLPHVLYCIKSAVDPVTTDGHETRQWRSCVFGLAG
jgi:hypothetical protein